MGASAWSEKTTWSFTGGADGGQPYTTLTTTTKRVSANAILYGTTDFGGSGYGTIFSPSHNKLVTIYNFTGGSDGAYPYQGTVADKTRTLYASTDGASGCGTVVKLPPPAGKPDDLDPIDNLDVHGRCGWLLPRGLQLTKPAFKDILWSFSGNPDGAVPESPPIVEKAGALYGTASGGGGNLHGIVYRLDPPAKGSIAWTETLLWTFNQDDGNTPAAALVSDNAGTLYSTTFNGGAHGSGVVFALSGTGFAPQRQRCDRDVRSPHPAST